MSREPRRPSWESLFINNQPTEGVPEPGGTQQLRDDLLFYGADLRAVLEVQARRMLGAIQQYDANRLLNTNSDDLVSYFVELSAVEPIRLREADISVDQHETKVDVRHRFDYDVWDKSSPALVPGTAVSLHVPFDGDPELFRHLCELS